MTRPKIKNGASHLDNCNRTGWMSSNEFILRGHRPQLGTFRLCSNSILRIHSETFNIWSHLIGEKIARTIFKDLNNNVLLYTLRRRFICSFGNLHFHNWWLDRRNSGKDTFSWAPSSLPPVRQSRCLPRILLPFEGCVHMSAQVTRPPFSFKTRRHLALYRYIDVAQLDIAVAVCVQFQSMKELVIYLLAVNSCWWLTDTNFKNKIESFYLVDRFFYNQTAFGKWSSSFRIGRVHTVYTCN